MATFVVTTLIDENNGTGQVSLREAIESANAQNGFDTVTFNSLLEGTISLVNGEIAITDSLDLLGPGAETLVIDAGGNSRIFLVDDASYSNLLDVNISGLTLTGGSAEFGGAIFNNESLAIADSTLTGNSAGSQGGAIYNNSDGTGGATLSITNSTISDNTSEDSGGGIGNGGSLVVTNSLITGILRGLAAASLMVMDFSLLVVSL
ncbi:MAG: hypothetical protein HC890_18580 [Chloroflexaceae bacterium]|nr:hypothetical protein [Chloroflexaceae bacterium]